MNDELNQLFDTRKEKILNIKSKIEEVNNIYARNYLELIKKIIEKSNSLKKWQNFDVVEGNVGNYIISSDDKNKEISSFYMHEEGIMIELYFANKTDKYINSEDEEYYDIKLINEKLLKSNISIMVNEERITIIFYRNIIKEKPPTTQMNNISNNFKKH